MRKRTPLILITLLSLLSRADASGLGNSGFETPRYAEPPACDQAAGWERWGSWANRHTDQPKWRARNGSSMVAYHHWQSDTTDVGWHQDVTNLVGGSYYRFSVWALWTSDCNASNVVLKIEPFEGGTPYKVDKYTAKDIRDRWTFITVQTRLAKDITRARFVIECNHGFAGDTEPADGAIKFDDAAIRCLSFRK